MKRDVKNGSTGRTICTRSSAVASASTEQETPGFSLRRSARGTQSTCTKPVTPTSSTRRSERLASSPASVTRNFARMEKKPYASSSRRSHKGKNVSSEISKGSSNKPARNAYTSSSDIEESKGKPIDNLEESTDEIKKQEAKMTARCYRALYRGHLKKEPNASSIDDELVVVGCSRRVPAGIDDARDDNSSSHANPESKGLPVGETSLEKGPGFPVEVTRDTEKMVLDLPPMVDTVDGSVIGSPSENPETQKLRDSKTSLETDIDLPLKRKRDTAEIVMDACANADDRIMSSDGVVPSPSGCTNNNQPERCDTCQKRQKVNDDLENLSVCSCIAQPVQESDHVSQDMKEPVPATSRDYGENGQKMQKSYDPKFSSMYPEYWVPVQLSDVQMEQYCRILVSKSLSLSSLSRNDLVGALEGTLTSVRKTCDHPYVMDASLKQLITKNLELHEILDVEVKASGKLHLLDAMLTQIKAKGLKAVVFYQATQSPEGLLLANILEDFLSQRFGQNSYEHGVCLSKKSAINNFNKENQCFILLLETRACSPSIKLLRAEAFILFGSCLNPSLDVKLLEKIKIESSSERTKIFRLYSVCTVEEKALILARQNKPLENLNRPLTHALLMWGASYLFEKLDHFHGSGTPESGVLLEKSIKDAVIHEFSSIISSNVGEENEGKLCLLLEAKHVQGYYSTDATLFGEEHVKLSDDISPNIFWAKLLGGKNPMWKYFSDTPQRSRKRVRHLQGSEETAKVGNGGNIKKKKKASGNVVVDNDEREASGKDHMGDLESSKVTTLKSSRGSASGTYDSLNGNDVTGLYSMGGHISGIPEDMLAGIDWQQIPRESQRSLYAVIKPEMAKLCLSEDSASMAEKFLEYIIENHRVCKEPATTLQAFQIALSWIAASFIKQKCNREESLARAKSELGFTCSKEEVDYIYSFLLCMKSLFLERAQGLQLDCLGTKKVNESLSGDTVRQEKNNTKSMRSSDGEECMTEKRGNHYSSVTKDVEKTISGIKKICSKKLQKLVQTHEEKKMELMNRNADKKQKLQTSKKVEVSYIRVTCSGLSTRSLLDNIQRVEDDFERKNDDLKRETDECLKSLEQMHEAAKKKLAEDEACWISRIENWAQAELMNCAPIQSCNNKHLIGLCSSNTSKNAPDVQTCNDASGEATYADTNCMVARENQICDRVTSATPDEDVPSRVPEIFQSFANLAKSASLESSLNREEAVVSSHAGSDAGNILDQQNEKACSPDELALPMPHPASVVKTNGSFESDQDDHEICPMPSSPGGKQPDPAENFQGQNIESAIEAQPAGSPMPLSPSGKQPDPAANIQGKNIEVPIEAEPAVSHMPSSSARQQRDPAANIRGENIETAIEPQPAGSPMPSSSAGQQPDPAEKNVEAAIEAQPAGSPMPCSPSGKQPDPEANIQGKNIEVAIEPEPAESPMPASPARQQPDPVANIQGENIETAIEPQPAGSHMSSSSAGQQSGPAEKNIEAAIESQPAGSETVETGGFAALEQVDQVACPLPSSSAGNQPGSGASIESQNISTSAEPHIAGPGAVEMGDYAVLDQEIMGAQGACSQPSPLIGTQADLAANTECQNIATVAQLHTAGSDASSPGNQSDAAVNIECLYNNTTVAEPHRTGSDACEMEVAEPDAQVEQSSFANNVAPLVHEGVVEPSAGVTAPAPSLLNNATGQNAIRSVPHIPFPVFSDPFQHELEKLRRESENTKKIYEEKKSVLNAELDRKMAELQAEYQRKFQEVEAERTAKTTKIETSKNRVIMNKLLAGAFLSKCTSRMASHPSGTPRGRIQQLVQRAAQVNTLRNYHTASAPTLAPAPAPLQPQASSFTSSVSRSSGLPPNPMHCPMPQPRQPLISNTAPSSSASPLSATNLGVNARLVSPVPHINSYRSSSSSIPIPTTTPTSSAVPQASTYPTALSQQQEEQQQQHQHQQNLGSNDVVCLSDDE